MSPGEGPLGGRPPTGLGTLGSSQRGEGGGGTGQAGQTGQLHLAPPWGARVLPAHACPGASTLLGGQAPHPEEDLREDRQ